MISKNLPTGVSLVFTVVTMSITLVACGQNSEPDVRAANTAIYDNAFSETMIETKTTAEVLQPELWPRRSKSPARDTNIEKRAMGILMKMSLQEKVGQIIQPELKYVTPDDVRKYHLGSVLNGGGTTPNNNKYATAQDWASLAEEFYQASMDESDGKVAIPLIWGSDAVHGNNNAYGATLFPHNIGLGAANEPSLIRRIGRATAIEVAATGVNWAFAPTVAVARDVRWGRTYESYSEAPDIVSLYASEMVNGLQGTKGAPGEYLAGNLVATAKHFIGDGGTTLGIDRGDTSLSEKEMVEIHAPGYFSALDSNVLTAMASFNSWNGNKIHGHEYLLGDILKQQLGFDGFVVSDWNGHQQVPGCTASHCAKAINAGLDMIMVPEHWQQLFNNTLNDTRSGIIPMARLDDAVLRILRVKLHTGLFDAGSVLTRNYVGDTSLVGSARHRKLAREAVRKSLVMLKNNDGILPLSPKMNILVAGDAADNIAKQAGGWTLSWQGTGNTNDDFPGATSIYDGINTAVSAAGGNVHLSPSGSWDKDSFPNGESPDVVIYVFGEEPYAEWHGDIANIEYQYGAKTDLAQLKSFQEKGLPVVSVFITGRPLWVNKEMNASDAFVTAWLPGSEGRGVADVLLRTNDDQVNFDFRGRLSFSWPKYVTQAKLNLGQPDYDPLFPYGYGLTYADSVFIGNDLPELSQRTHAEEIEELWVFVSRVIAPWELRLEEGVDTQVVVAGNRASSGNDENLLILAVDKVAQEDARRVIWKGIRPARIVVGTGFAQDLSPYLLDESALQFDLKLNQMPTNTVEFSLDCGDNCGKKLVLTPQLNAMQLGIWDKISIPIKCLAGSHTDLKKVSEVLSINSSGALDISLANIKIVPTRAKLPLGAKRISCS